MSYYDPFGRRYRPSPRDQARSQPDPYGRGRSRGVPPSLEDYYRLVEAYEAQQAQLDDLARQLETTEEALRQQTRKAMDLKAELQEARAEAERRRLESEAQSTAAESNPWQGRYLRLQAEIETYRRRLEQRVAQEANEQRIRLLQDMLPLADHLEMALKHLDGVSAAEASLGQSFRDNLEAILQAFRESMARHGVEVMEPVGQPFDPACHEAVGQAPSHTIPADRVAAVVQAGYRVDGRLLRPARVLVSTGAPTHSGG